MSIQALRLPIGSLPKQGSRHPPAAPRLSRTRQPPKPETPRLPLTLQPARTGPAACASAAPVPAVSSPAAADSARCEIPPEQSHSPARPAVTTPPLANVSAQPRRPCLPRTTRLHETTQSCLVTRC